MRIFKVASIVADYKWLILWVRFKVALGGSKAKELVTGAGNGTGFFYLGILRLFVD
jgi:hypothetical protein